MISDLKDVAFIYVVNNLDLGGGGFVIFCVDPKNNTLLSTSRDLETDKLMTKSTLFLYIYCIS